MSQRADRNREVPPRALWRDKADEQTGVCDQRRSAHEHKRESGSNRAAAKESACRNHWAWASEDFDHGGHATSGQKKRADGNVPSQ